MIGQVETIRKLKSTDASSILLVGNKHWGKKTLLRELLSKEESVYEITGNAATFRGSLEKIYATVRPTSYLIPDLDLCNATIQNLLLKVLEEPPVQARFFLTANRSILPTIESRCVIFRMQAYSEMELNQFPVDNAFIGVGDSPGQRKLLNFQESVGLATTLRDIEDMVATKTLALVLRNYKEFEKRMSDSNVSHEWYLLLAPHVFKDGQALDWLRQQPLDGVRYVRKQFIMKYWLERRFG